MPGMDQKAARAAAAKALKARGLKLRKGHWRLGDPKRDSVVWYVDLRAAGVGPRAALRFEVGAWAAPLGQPEPEGGAVDCPLLLDRPIEAESTDDVVAAVDRLVDRVEVLSTTDDLARALAAGDLDGALVDRSLRDLLT